MKKLISGLLICPLLICVLSVFALAAGPAFQVSTAQAAPGEEVTITVSTVDNPGIASFWLEVEYDAAALEWTAAEAGSLDGMWDVGVGESALWINADNCADDAVILALTFIVKETAPAGKTEVSVSYDPDNVFDENENNVSFAVIPGGVEVIGGQVIQNDDDIQIASAPESDDRTEAGASPLPRLSTDVASAPESYDVADEVVTAGAEETPVSSASSAPADIQTTTETEQGPGGGSVRWPVVTLVMIVVIAVIIVVVAKARTSKGRRQS